MILTVTPNPTLDRVLFVRNFAMQDVVRADREVVAPSGKGIDVALVLHAMGAATHAIALNAGRHGALLAELVAEQGIGVDWIAAQGETRMATLLTDVAVGRQSTILAHTLHAGPAELEQMLARIDAHAANAWGLVSAGSLPPGLPPAAHARILARAVEQGLVTLLDSSGAGLVAGVRARPHILKVNVAEFSALLAATRRPPNPQDSALDAHRNGAHPAADAVYDATDDDPDDDPDDDAGEEGVADSYGDSVREDAPLGYDAILRLAEQIAPQVGTLAREAIVVTLGQNGILAATDTGIYHAPALPVPVVSPAGAGDAVSAGIMLARRRGEDWQSALIWATALAASVVSHAGTGECSRTQVLALAEEATVVELDTAQ